MAWYLHAGDSLTKQPSWSEFLTNQKPYQDQSIHISSVWNFCVRSSGVLSRESVDVLVKCRLFSQAALAENYVWLKLKLAQDHARARRRRRDWGEVSELPSLASTPWSVRCLSSLVTVRRIFKTISRPFAELWKNPPVSSYPGLTVNGACELPWQLTLDLHQLDLRTRPWGSLGITFRAPIQFSSNIKNKSAGHS